MPDDDARLADILERVNRDRPWYDRERRAETLIDALEMILSRVERLEDHDQQRDADV